MAVKKNELVDSTNELNKLAGKAVYVAVYDASMIATTRISDLNDFLRDEDVILNFGDDPENFKVFYGIVLDPEVLPTKLPVDGVYADCGILLFSYDNYTTVKVDDTYGKDTSDVIEDIEVLITEDNVVNIDDFSILYGKKIDFMLQVKSPGFTAMNKEGMVLCLKTT